MKVAGRWVYLYRAIDQYGQVIDVLVSPMRHYELGMDIDRRHRLTTIFTELAHAI